MLNFEFPYLFILLFLPFLCWKFLKPNEEANDDTIPEILFPHINRLKSSFEESKNNSGSKLWFVVMISMLWTFFVISIMHPRWISDAHYTNHKGYDMIFAVDISLSMNALDLSSSSKEESRLNIAKQVLSNFVQKRVKDRLGLIVFGQYAFLQVPMTFDSSALVKILNNDLAGIAGPSTAIGDAIGIAIREFKERQMGARILILLTDGTDNASNISPLNAAAIAKKHNIKIYTVGIGSSTEVPVKNADGTISKIKIDIDEDTLQQIAQITGGQYFHAKNDLDLSKIYDHINMLEKVELETSEPKIKSLYRYPLGVACILFLMICLIPLYNRVLYGI